MHCWALLGWVQLGNLAAWFGALATTAAVVLSLFVALRQASERATERREGQARRVSAWTSKHVLEGETFPLKDGTESQPFP